MHESTYQMKSSELITITSNFGWYQLTQCDARFHEMSTNEKCKLQEQR